MDFLPFVMNLILTLQLPDGFSEKTVVTDSWVMKIIFCDFTGIVQMNLNP